MVHINSESAGYQLEFFLFHGYPKQLPILRIVRRLIDSGLLNQKMDGDSGRQIFLCQRVYKAVRKSPYGEEVLGYDG